MNCSSFTYTRQPGGAKSATIDLLYQPASWQYNQFLYLANNGNISFLGNEGNYLLDASLKPGQDDAGKTNKGRSFSVYAWACAVYAKAFFVLGVYTK